MRFKCACLLVFSGWILWPGCSESSATEIPGSLHFLIGKWVTDDGMIEEWNIESSCLWRGTGYRLENGDTTVSEYLTLVATDTGVYYVADVVEQDQLPTAFKLIEPYAPKRFVFSNTDHDFPTHIAYEEKSKDNLTVMVSNDKQGFTLHFHRAAFIDH